MIPDTGRCNDENNRHPDMARGSSGVISRGRKQLRKGEMAAHPLIEGKYLSGTGIALLST